MKTLKRVLCMILALLTIGSLGACGVNGKPTEAPSLNPVELAKLKLKEAYDVCCEGSKTEYAKLGYDRMSLTIDTNPEDTYSSAKKCEKDAISAIQVINLYLGLPSSLMERISSTRAMDGTQSQNCGTYTATWNYHPDNGLKIIYEVNP